MEQDVQLAPFLPDHVEKRLFLIRIGDVERLDDLGVQLLGERTDIFLGLLVEIGDRKIGALSVKRLGAAIGNGLIIGDADNQRLLSCK